jgi:hypothetical protein
MAYKIFTGAKPFLKANIKPFGITEIRCFLCLLSAYNQLKWDIIFQERKMQLSRREFLLASSLGIPSFFTKGKSLNAPFSVQKQGKEPIHETWIKLDLPNLAWNLNKIKQHVRVPVMAVIKANAYGHGLLEVGRFLDKSGIDALMVCKLPEAIQLRESGVTRIICDSNSE